MYHVILSVEQEYIPAIKQIFQHNYPNYTINFVNSKELPGISLKDGFPGGLLRPSEQGISCVQNTLWICDRDSHIRELSKVYHPPAGRPGLHGDGLRSLIPVIAFSHENNSRESLMGAPWMILSPEGLTPELMEEVIHRFNGTPMLIAKTRRCIIRELTMDELPALLALQQQNIKNPGGCFFPERCAAPDQFLNDYIRHQYHYYGFGIFGIFSEDAGLFMGIAGFSSTDLPDADAEVSYALLRMYQQNGYAREAVRALLTEGSRRWQLKHVAARISPDNSASLKLAGELAIDIHLLT